jgi:hypothetical protein
MGGADGRAAQIVPPEVLFEQDAEFLVLTPEFFSIVLVSLAGVGIIIVCGLLPLLEIRHGRPAVVLRRESAGPSGTSSAVRAGLIIAQMACCCLLVVCTGLLYAGFRTALQTGISHHLGKPILATMQVHPDVDVDLTYFQHVEQSARALPGVSISCRLERRSKVATPKWNAPMPDKPTGRRLTLNPRRHNTAPNRRNVPQQDLHLYARSFHEAAKNLAEAPEFDSGPSTDLAACCPVQYLTPRTGRIRSRRPCEPPTRHYPLKVAPVLDSRVRWRQRFPASSPDSQYLRSANAETTPSKPGNTVEASIR